MVAMFAIATGMWSSTVQSDDDSGDVAVCTSLEDQYNRAIPAVVPIGTNLGTGTAFAVNDATTLLTAYHVIEGATEVYANWTSGRVGIAVVDTAPEFDLALLKIEKPLEGY